ncbi:ATP-dependent (S)-NAD(P)H-hydrate dehydratase [Bombyx mandarina]|uniref:ATP-dependent (S)-NAD(P)H-hydrate dehydratase n=1 Tax=Bombyx mandarina TaxID=7092 RepID=A0A6J2K7X0_BOMMA|nr:ATP-dependent (S)-NAD(P)H-hydrate dehydratase [Bombyx mandarina]
MKTNLILLKSFSLIRHRYNMDPTSMKNLIKICIPPLDKSSHKGQAGRIGVIGGSLEYTGAPYFAGISSLKVGADLAHIFCSSVASAVIKSYSPELIVHPLLDKQDAVEEILPWFDRLHSIVIGPGLGRDWQTFDIIAKLIEVIKQKKIPIIIDADGLFLITEKPNLIKDFDSPVILTPNKIEFERLSNKIDVQTMGKNVTILKKGPNDELISPFPEFTWSLETGGSGRRCGGQGDLLSGTIATFMHWTLANIDKIKIPDISNNKMLAASLSCYAACILVRKCNEKAFKLKGRSMLATDMIEFIHDAFEELYDQ